MLTGMRITIAPCVACVVGLLVNQAAYAMTDSFSQVGIDRLERLRFGHTNRDIRLRERLNVLEWSVMGSRQPGSASERFTAVEQKLQTEGVTASINYGQMYDPARPRTGYLFGPYSGRRIHRYRSKEIIVAAAHKPLALRANKAKPRQPAVEQTVATGNREVVRQLLRKGNDLYMAGDYSKSITELTRAIRMSPSYAPAYVSRGFAYRKLGEQNKVRSDFQLAKKLDSRIQLPI